MEILSHFLTPIKILVAICLPFALLRLDYKSRIHRLVIIILGICFITEFTNTILISYSLPIKSFTSVSMIFHNAFWIYLLAHFTTHKNFSYLLLFCFVAFGIINLCCFEGLHNLNFCTFIVGAFIYIAIFIYESFYQLRKENLSFFTANDYLLLFTPVLLFFGISLMFGFRSKAITRSIIFGTTDLYSAVITFVDVVFYALMIAYIYREKRAKRCTMI